MQTLLPSQGEKYLEHKEIFSYIYFSRLLCFSFHNIVFKRFPCAKWPFWSLILKKSRKEKCSLSDSHWHLANVNVIANVKSKITVSCQQFSSDVIFSATSKVQNYQIKPEKNPYTQANMCLLHISKNFIYIF